MSLRTLGRKIKLDILHPEGDICEMLFANRRAQHACRLLLAEIEKKRGLTRAEFNKFAFDLRDGKVEAGFRYSRTRFYEQVRRTLLTLGLIGIQQRPFILSRTEFEPERRFGRGLIDKYVLIRQPIARRPPDGLNFVRLTWIICEKWNREFFEDG